MKLVFEIDLYQVIGDNFSCLVIVRGGKVRVCFKIERVQT